MWNIYICTCVILVLQHSLPELVVMFSRGRLSGVRAKFMIDTDLPFRILWVLHQKWLRLPSDGFVRDP